MALVSELHTTYPSDCPYVLAVREKYADWNWTLSHGYIRYGKGARSVVLEHRAVAELVHGSAVADLHVHHIDNNPTNNDAMNLVVLTSSDHIRVHRSQGGNLLMWCEICGAEYHTDRTRIDRNTRYCSTKCKAVAQTKRSKRPARHILINAIYTLQNFSALGRYFGVSDNAVRKWAKHYQINTRGVDGRLRPNVNFSQLADGHLAQIWEKARRVDEVDEALANALLAEIAAWCSDVVWYLTVA